MTRKIVRQILPQATPEYSQSQMNMFIDTLSKLIEEVRIPVTNIPNMPTETSITKLVPGDLYRIVDRVYIVLPGIAYTLSVEGTGSIGDVEVVTNTGTPSGVSASGSIGTLKIITNVATPDGVEGTANVGVAVAYTT